MSDELGLFGADQVSSNSECGGAQAGCARE